MLYAFNLMMFIVPALFSVAIHNYLRHGEHVPSPRFQSV